MSRWLQALRLVHPFPSALNAALVAAIATAAGGDSLRVALLAGGMLGIQLCIGATNDVVDRDLDAATKPYKPIPAGVVSPGTAKVVALTAGASGLVLALLAGPVPALLTAAMLGCGLVYDIWLKPTRWAWACFSLAFGLLPLYAWYGASAALPPHAEILVPIAALAGLALQLSNALVDVEEDAAGGLRTLATGLGAGRTWLLMTILLLAVHGLAWLSLAVYGRDFNPGLVAGSLLALAGVALASRRAKLPRQLGWTSQAIAIALLGWGWLVGVG